MSKRELAKALKRRLVEKYLSDNPAGSVPGPGDSFVRDLKVISDDNVIAGFLTCSVCGEVSIPKKLALRIAEDCGTANEWIRRVVACERVLGACCHDINRPEQASCIAQRPTKDSTKTR